VGKDASFCANAQKKRSGVKERENVKSTIKRNCLYVNGLKAPFDNEFG